MNTSEQPQNLQPASTPPTTIAEVETGITARSIDDAIKSPTLTMAIRSLGRNVVAPIICSAIARGMLYFGPSQRLDQEAQTMWAELLIDEYPHESLADVSVFLRGASLGKYGQEGHNGEITRKGETFGALSIVKLNTWFGQYLAEKAEAREREAKSEKGRYMAAGRELHPAVAESIKPVIAKVCAEQHTERDAAMMEARLKNLTRQLPTMTDQDLRDHYKLVVTDVERDVIMDEARRRGLMKQPGQSAETPTAQ